LQIAVNAWGKVAWQFAAGSAVASAMPFRLAVDFCVRSFCTPYSKASTSALMSEFSWKRPKRTRDATSSQLQHFNP